MFLQQDLVAFYLTQETPDLPGSSSQYTVVQYIPQEPGEPVSKSALRVTFPPDAALDSPVTLLTFGTNPEKCNVVLTSSHGVAPVHCKIYLQLNSGADVYLVESDGRYETQIRGGLSEIDVSNQMLSGGCRIVKRLYALKIGQYVFRFWNCINEDEKTRREQWFQAFEPVLVSQSMLEKQLRGEKAAYEQQNKLGQGGNGVVWRCMEKSSGLLVAMKQIAVSNGTNEDFARREIEFMKLLKHVSFLLI